MKKKSLILVLIIVVIISIIINFYQIRSYIIMYIYSKVQNNNSLMTKNNFQIHIPGGFSTIKRDWYPFVMCFNANNFSDYINRDLELSILYNFGHFKNSRSVIYNENSDYYSSFYGAYVIKQGDKKEMFGYNNNSYDFEMISKVPKYDMGVLVLESIGCNNYEIDFKLLDIYENKNYLGYNDWVLINADISTNSVSHRYRNNYNAYIQYGKPTSRYTGVDFKRINLKGRVYCRYFNQYDCTIFLYIIAPNFQIVNETDINILSKTEIK